MPLGPLLLSPGSQGSREDLRPLALLVFDGSTIQCRLLSTVLAYPFEFYITEVVQ